MSKVKIELKVSMNCAKCKVDILKAVTKLEGIDQITADLAKETVVVIGEVDPVCVVKKVRKLGKRADIVSVGPPKKPEDEKKKEDEKKEDEKKPPCCTQCASINGCTCIVPVGYCPLPPPCYGGYQTVVYPPEYCDRGGCIIL